MLWQGGDFRVSLWSARLRDDLEVKIGFKKEILRPLLGLLCSWWRVKLPGSRQDAKDLAMQDA
jgi:hypothetical protein